MPWEARQKRYWTVCWWAIFPYPCKKTKTVYCATGRWKQQCYGFFGQNWICVDGREYHYWSWCFGIGDIIQNPKSVCRDEIPDSSEGCDVAGDAPPGSYPSSGSYALEARATSANIVSGLVLGAIVGFLITQILATDQIGMIIGVIIGGILGGISGGSTRECFGSCRRSLLLLIIVLLIIWLLLIF